MNPKNAMTIASYLSSQLKLSEIETEKITESLMGLGLECYKPSASAKQDPLTLLPDYLLRVLLKLEKQDRVFLNEWMDAHISQVEDGFEMRMLAQPATIAMAALLYVMARRDLQNREQAEREHGELISSLLAQKTFEVISDVTKPKGRQQDGRQ